MLGGHPDIVCIPEGQFIADLLPRRGSGNRVDPFRVIADIEAHWRFQIWDFAIDPSRPGLDAIEPTYRATIEWLIRAYAAAHGRSGAHVWVDHQPGHLLHLWKLLQHFPDAKVVHIIRDGRAVAASLLPLDWGPNEIYAAARFWQNRVALGYAAASFLTPEQLCHLRYEDLLRNPEGEMRRLAAFLGIDYHPSLCESTGLQVPTFTKSQHALVGQPPKTDRITAWQRSLSKRQIEIFERLNAGFLQQLGYELVSTPGSRKFGWWEKAILIFKDQVKKARNRILFDLRRYVNLHLKSRKASR